MKSINSGMGRVLGFAILLGSGLGLPTFALGSTSGLVFFYHFSVNFAYFCLYLAKNLQYL